MIHDILNSVVDINILQLILITGSMVLGTALQASAGFGSGLVAIPLLVLIDPRLVPGPIIFSYVFFTALMAWRGRKNIVSETVRSISVGLLLGTILASLALTYISPQQVPMMIAFVILLGVMLSVFGFSFTVTALNLKLAGVMSGFMGNISGIGGPPLALLLQHQQPEFIRANLAVCFFIASLFAITNLTLIGILTIESIYLSLFLIPGILLGYLIGEPITQYIQQRHSRVIIIVLSTTSAITLILKQLLQ